MDEGHVEIKQNKNKAAFILKTVGFILLCGVLILLIVNSLLCVFKDDYYPTFGKSRLFTIASDSMEPELPTGSLIVCRVPADESEIEIGTVITFRVNNGKRVTVITHRVIEVMKNGTTGKTEYVTKGDNAPAKDSFHPAFSDVIGIYTGKKCAFLGYVIGFMQSSEGAISLILIIFVIVITVLMLGYLNKVRVWQETTLSAVKKCGQSLADSQEPNTETVADVLRMISEDPTDAHDVSEKEKKLKWFVENGTLPPDEAEGEAAEPIAEGGQESVQPPEEPKTEEQENAEPVEPEPEKAEPAPEPKKQAKPKQSTARKSTAKTGTNSTRKSTGKTGTGAASKSTAKTRTSTTRKRT